MAKQKKSQKAKGKRPRKRTIAPPSTTEPPVIKSFAPPENFSKNISVDDLRRSTANATWSVNEKLDEAVPLPRYPLGGSVEGLTIADPSHLIDWSQIFSIPPRNPELLKRVIELGILSVENLALLPIPAPERISARRERKGVKRQVAIDESKKGRKT